MTSRPLGTSAGENAGLLAIYYGGARMDPFPDFLRRGRERLALLGSSLADAGDLVGDGGHDLLVGSAGEGSSREGIVSLLDFRRHFLTGELAGRTLNAGSTVTLTWLGAARADLALSTDEGVSWRVWARGVGGRDQNRWSGRVPEWAGTGAQWKLMDLVGPGR